MEVTKMIKDFLRECKKPKKMRTGDLAELIYDNQDSIVDFYTKKSHLKNASDTVNELFNKMACENFVKALNKIRKSKDEEVQLNIGMVVIIAGFIERRHKDAEMPEGLIESYKELINKLLKSRIKEVNKKLNLDEDLIGDLLIIVPEKSYLPNDKVVGIYSQKMLRKMYILSQDKDLGIDNTEIIGKIFKKLLGKKMLDLIAINILLEKKEFLKNFNDKQQAIWNLMTKFALETIESQDKKHIGELIEYFASRRMKDERNNRDAARRISLTSIDAEQYPKTAKVVSKFAKSKSNIEKYL
jgi:hypothetical protein